MTEPNRQATTLGRWMTYAGWALALGVVALVFDGVLERQYNPNQDLTAVSRDGAAPEVVLQRNRYGHYVASGRINGRPVTFLLDTGATDVSVPAGLAAQLGLERGAPARYRTANGSITTYRTQLERVELGAIALESVRAHINPGMAGEDVLLGMSFLKHLDLEQRGDSLTLRQRVR